MGEGKGVGGHLFLSLSQEKRSLRHRFADVTLALKRIPPRDMPLVYPVLFLFCLLCTYELLI